MTWGELDIYISEKLSEGINNVIDWRPAAGMYIDDIVKVSDGKAYVPRNGIRYWLGNGDSIIYVKKAEDD